MVQSCKIVVTIFLVCMCVPVYADDGNGNATPEKPEPIKSTSEFFNSLVNGDVPENIPAVVLEKDFIEQLNRWRKQNTIKSYVIDEAPVVLISNKELFVWYVPVHLAINRNGYGFEVRQEYIFVARNKNNKWQLLYTNLLDDKVSLPGNHNLIGFIVVLLMIIPFCVVMAVFYKRTTKSYSSFRLVLICIPPFTIIYYIILIYRHWHRKNKGVNGSIGGVLSATKVILWMLLAFLIGSSSLNAEQQKSSVNDYSQLIFNMLKENKGAGNQSKITLSEKMKQDQSDFKGLYKINDIKLEGKPIVYSDDEFVIWKNNVTYDYDDNKTSSAITYVHEGEKELFFIVENKGKNLVLLWTNAFQVPIKFLDTSLSIAAVIVMGIYGAMLWLIMVSILFVYKGWWNGMKRLFLLALLPVGPIILVTLVLREISEPNEMERNTAK